MMRVEDDRVVLSREAVQALLAFGPKTSGSVPCQQLLIERIGGLGGEHETCRTRVVASDGTIVLVLEVGGGWYGMPQRHRVPLHMVRATRPAKGEELHILFQQRRLELMRRTILIVQHSYEESSVDFPPYLQVIPERFSLYDCVPTAALFVDAERLHKLRLVQRAIFPDRESGIVLRLPAGELPSPLDPTIMPKAVRFDCEAPGQDGPIRAYGAIMPRRL